MLVLQYYLLFYSPFSYHNNKKRLAKCHLLWYDAAKYMGHKAQLELDFEYIETALPGGGKLLRIEKQTIANGEPRDTWFAVEKYVVNGWRFIAADNEFYYLEKQGSVI